MDTVPLDATTKLSGAVIECGLQVRTLVANKQRCTRCTAETMLGHEQVCAELTGIRVHRHEDVKWVTHKHLTRVKDGTCVVEPAVIAQRLPNGTLVYTHKTRRRTDLRVTGPAAIAGHATEFDITAG